MTDRVRLAAEGKSIVMAGLRDGRERRAIDRLSDEHIEAMARVLDALLVDVWPARRWSDKKANGRPEPQGPV